MMFADAGLARRVEGAEAAIARGCTEGQPGAAYLEAGGGIALFLGSESPLTQAVGMGLSGPVTATELDGIETFFRRRGARVCIDLCPLADAGLLEMLAGRGYRPVEFNNVLIKPLAGSEITFTPHARRAVAGEQELWAHTAGHGFFDQAELTSEEMDVGRAIFSMTGAQCYFAVTELGEVAGGAALAVHGGLATLFADSVIGGFRRRGLHGELIAARLNEAMALGCDLATASTLPGSASQRNFERAGFRVVYTKVTLAR